MVRLFLTERSHHFFVLGEDVVERDEDWTRLEINFNEINWMSIRVVIRGSSDSSRRKVRWSDLLIGI